MADGLVDTTARAETPEDRRIYGIAVAKVVSNCDETRMGRVKVRLPWLPGYEPWARVAALSAGPDSGTYFIPREGDEVLVAFNHGDVREPYVVGSIWNARGEPPRDGKTDPEHKRLIRTPKGLQIEFDDNRQALSITNEQGRRIVIGPDRLEIAMDDQRSTAITMDGSGNLTIKAASTITLDARVITITAGANVALSGAQSARIDGGGFCSVNAAQILIG